MFMLFQLVCVLRIHSIWSAYTCTWLKGMVIFFQPVPALLSPTFQVDAFASFIFVILQRVYAVRIHAVWSPHASTGVTEWLLFPTCTRTEWLHFERATELNGYIISGGAERQEPPSRLPDQPHTWSALLQMKSTQLNLPIFLQTLTTLKQAPQAACTRACHTSGARHHPFQCSEHSTISIARITSVLHTFQLVYRNFAGTHLEKSERTIRLRVAIIEM